MNSQDARAPHKVPCLSSQAASPTCTHARATKVRGMLAKETDTRVCVENEWLCTSHVHTLLLIFRRRRQHNSTTTTNFSPHTHTQSSTRAPTHHTHRATDEGNKGHIHGKHTLIKQDTPTSLFATCPPTPPSCNAHTTHLDLD